MSELDEKLEEVLCELGEYREITLDEALAQIKQAFNDEGYTKIHRCNDVPKDNPFIGITYHYSKKSGNNAVEIMCGKEWYERFNDEISKFTELGLDIERENIAAIVVLFRRAAKSAGGIDE